MRAGPCRGPSATPAAQAGGATSKGAGSGEQPGPALRMPTSDDSLALRSSLPPRSAALPALRGLRWLPPALLHSPQVQAFPSGPSCNSYAPPALPPFPPSQLHQQSTHQQLLLIRRTLLKGRGRGLGGQRRHTAALQQPGRKGSTCSAAVGEAGQGRHGAGTACAVRPPAQQPAARCRGGWAADDMLLGATPSPRACIACAATATSKAVPASTSVLCGRGVGASAPHPPPLAFRRQQCTPPLRGPRSPARVPGWQRPGQRPWRPPG